MSTIAWLLFSALLASADEKIFTVSGTRVVFLSDHERHLVLSKKMCPPLATGFACEAWRATEKVSRKRLGLLKGGADPGAVACSTQVSGTNVTGINPNGFEATFCLMKDGSLVSAGTLDYFSRSNDDH